MAILLGVDTGGTYTDAVLIDDARRTEGNTEKIIAAAKSLTKHSNLIDGIQGAVDGVLSSSNVNPAEIGLVSISTTLATNALVEGRGGKVALIAIGFAESDLKRAGLERALADGPLVQIAGGHTPHGRAAGPLDIDALDQWLNSIPSDIEGIAVAGYFAVRNPEHELAVAERVLAATSLPVTCSHELSAKLHGPKRAATCVLNARLVPMISQLTNAAATVFSRSKINAPLMIVRGDGALVSAEFAARRPIETILSGPAASLVGASWLSNEQQAVVVDIGGTTSDIAILEDGRPRLNPAGATVGGFQTMVEAVDMHTFGLGGDSEISVSTIDDSLLVGPSRVVPLSLLAHGAPDAVLPVLDKQASADFSGRYDGYFATRTLAGEQAKVITDSQARVLERLSIEPQPVGRFVSGASQWATLRQLVSRGLVQLSGFTPSDAKHVLGDHTAWNREAAALGARVFARRKNRFGRPLATSEHELAQSVVRRLERLCAEATIEAVISHDGTGMEDGAQNMFVQSALDRTPGVASFSVALDRPVIGLGASAHQYLHNCADLLHARSVVPEHAGVANAVGAVVGQINLKIEIGITQPVEGRFEVFGTKDSFGDEESAYCAAEEQAQQRARLLAREAGADAFEVAILRQSNTASVEGRDMFVDGQVTATVTARPPLAEQV